MLRIIIWEEFRTEKNLNGNNEVDINDDYDDDDNDCNDDDGERMNQSTNEEGAKNFPVFLFLWLLRPMMDL